MLGRRVILSLLVGFSLSLSLSGCKKEEYVIDNVDYGMKETISLVVDFSCKHCREEIKKLRGKFNLKLAVLLRDRGNALEDIYFKCSKNKAKAINDILSRQFDYSVFRKCDIEKAYMQLEKNFRVAINRGLKAIPGQIR